MGYSGLPSNQRVKWIDAILEWRDDRNALMNVRISAEAEGPIGGPLSEEGSLVAGVKYVLKVASCAMPPCLIRDMLREAGFPLGKYKGNPLLSIHPTLKRLVAKGCIREVLCEGQKQYEWIELKDGDPG